MTLHLASLGDAVEATGGREVSRFCRKFEQQAKLLGGDTLVPVPLVRAVMCIATVVPIGSRVPLRLLFVIEGEACTGGGTLERTLCHCRPLGDYSFQMNRNGNFLMISSV